MKKILFSFALCAMSLSMLAQDANEATSDTTEGFRFTTIDSIAITPVKDQNRSGTCWSYSTIGFLESELIRMGKGVHDLSEMFAPLAKNKHLNFIYDNELEDGTFIKSDALKIKQILSNILSNAIKYTNDGNVNFKVSKDNNTTLIFNISDEGIGIPQDKLDEIFKPFSRINNNESLIEGSGFGLFVEKGLIELLNGKINVNSEVGKGSSFTIKIPVEFIERKERLRYAS